MSEILNANPTIRNASDLPSRRRKHSSGSSTKTYLVLFSSTVPASAYAPDPFAHAGFPDSDSSEDDDTVEPIDEQEIYGEFATSQYLLGKSGTAICTSCNDGPCHRRRFRPLGHATAFGSTSSMSTLLWAIRYSPRACVLDPVRGSTYGPCYRRSSASHSCWQQATSIRTRPHRSRQQGSQNSYSQHHRSKNLRPQAQVIPSACNPQALACASPAEASNNPPFSMLPQSLTNASRPNLPNPRPRTPFDPRLPLRRATPRHPPRPAADLPRPHNPHGVHHAHDNALLARDRHRTGSPRKAGTGVAGSLPR